MSGGEFDYAQNSIKNIVGRIEEILEQQGQPIPRKLSAYHSEFEETEYPTFPKEIEDKMKEGLLLLKKAYIYAQRIDWYLSGDDGDETFLERLEKDLNELKGI